MFSLVLHALRARRAQALAMFALAALAGLGSAAAPWFLAWGTGAVARTTIAAAPATDRLVVGSGNPVVDVSAGNPLDALSAAIEENLPIEGIEATVAAELPVSVLPADAPIDEPAVSESTNVNLATSGGVCEHLRLVEGGCALDAGEVVLPRSVARALGVVVGDPVRITAMRVREAHVLTVAGVYEVADPFALYWFGTDLLPEGTDQPASAFVGEETLLDLQPRSMKLSLHVLLPVAAFIDPGSDLRDTLSAAAVELGGAGFPLSTPALGLLDQIARDRLLVVSGVLVGAGQLVLVSWIGLFLAVRHTSDERRGDIGLLKLRGTTTRRVWAMIGLTSGAPMLAGTLVGAAGGFLAAGALAYRTDPGAGLLAVADTAAVDTGRTAWLSLAAAAVAGLGGLVAAMVAEWRTTRTPVADLLRRVPGGRRGWRADVADLVVVVVAAAGVYQGWVDSRDADAASVLGLLSPLLVGLAVALVAARALPVVAARVGASALRAGRVAAALAALQLARRQGTQRVFAVLVVATAVFTTTTILWQAATAAWHQRAVQELGADRVLTVEAPGAAALMHAVRSVDPEGRYAMAVASTLGVDPADRVVAVDTSRYAAVGRLPEGLITPAALVPLLRPEQAVAPRVADGPLTLDVTAPDLGPPLGVRVYLSTMDGQERLVDYAPLAPGRQAAQVAVDGCAPECRLVGIEVRPPAGYAVESPLTVVIHELRQPGATVLGPPMLGDITRWRTTLADAAPPILATDGGQLAVTLPGGYRPPAVLPDHRVMPLAAPVPLPVAATVPEGARGVGRIAVVGGAEAPATVAAHLDALPVVGDRGVLVDLEYALLSSDASAESADLSVWLTADAPDSLVAALGEHGVTVLSERSVAGRASELARFGPGLALQFSYFTVAVILLLAATVALVGSTVERSGRVAELVALRGQGLSVAEVRAAGLAGTAIMVVAAALTGILAALLAEGLVATALPIFADGWRLLPAPAGLTPGSLLVSLGLVIAALGLASLLGAGRLVAAASAGPTNGGAAGGRHGGPQVRDRVRAEAGKGAR